MTGPIRGFVTFVGLAALACALTACDGPSVGGTPAPATPSASAPSSSAAQSNTPLAGMSPCTTLDQALAGQGYPPAKPESADIEHSCGTDRPDGHGVSLQLQDGMTIDQDLTDPSVAKTGSINGRKAILERGLLHATGGCAVRMEVKPHSRAIVVGTLANGSTDEACDYADSVAKAVEVLLPKAG
ncbi:hypothetical protein [Amycolatopsis sp. NPDC051903]|uniref:hypothetical protein n=1 Tax=Amycolatopsis sp. NPDC051903 TaxID=3363936 RepID=UPI00378B2260